jgi:thioredoxin 1
MTSSIEHVSEDSFEGQVLGSSEPFLLDFSAVWCAPCRALEPILEEIAREHRGRIRIGKIDMDESVVLATQLGIRGAPTLVLFRGGKEQRRQLGLTSKRKLLQLLELPEAPVQLPASR